MSLLLCLTMLSAGITAGASNTAELRVASASAKAGEQVRVDIKAVGFSNVAGIQLKVNFGSSLTFVSKESNYIELDDNNSTVKDGIFSLAVTGEQSETNQNVIGSIITSDNEESLLTLVFEIPRNAVENEVYDIKFIASDTRASDTDEKLIPLTLTNGTVTVKPEEPMTVELINADDSQVVDTRYFNSNTADYSYTFDSAVSGSYILRASRPKYVTREYNITVTDGTQIQQSVKIHHPGDINGDGQITQSDNTKVLRHVKKTAMLKNYEFSCADINGDGQITQSDNTKVLRHLKGTSLLW